MALKTTMPVAGSGWARDVDGGGTGLELDIFLYMTLLAHAMCTRLPVAVRHTTQLLVHTGCTCAHSTAVLLCAMRGSCRHARYAVLLASTCACGG